MVQGSSIRYPDGANSIRLPASLENSKTTLFGLGTIGFGLLVTLMNLENKFAVVTGASTGLGKVFSRFLVKRGATVFGLARGSANLEMVRAELGDCFVPQRCNVACESEVEAAFAAIQAQSDRIDVLVNNAGIGHFEAVDVLPVCDWEAQVDTNLTGVFLCTRQVVPVMRRQNERCGFGGHIINVASVAGIVGNPNLSAYNATKFGLRGFSEALMKELRSFGIRVTSVCPGSVATEFGRKAGSHRPPNPMQADDIAATVMHILEAPDNYLISEVVMRPLRPRGFPQPV